MSFQQINLGSAPNDGNGDSLRSGGQKINDNFDECFNLNDPVRAVDGTVTAPAFSFADDTNSGVYSAAANELGFVTDGVERVRIDDTGNVGVGTTSPAALLDVAGAIAFDDLSPDKTIIAGGTTGAATINKVAGSVNFAAAATSLVVTNSLVNANSLIIATVMTNDSTMKSASAVVGSGSFTLHANAAATAETRVAWLVLN
jgi:hypothetical protein